MQELQQRLLICIELFERLAFDAELGLRVYRQDRVKLALSLDIRLGQGVPLLAPFSYLLRRLRQQKTRAAYIMLFSSPPARSPPNFPQSTARRRSCGAVHRR